MNNFSGLFLVSAAALLLCGCAGMPGEVATSKSMLDGEHLVSVEPGWLHGGGLRTPAKAGGYWTSKSPDRFLLELTTASGRPIAEFKMGINGVMTEFTNAVEAGVFVMPLHLIREMVEAKSTVLKLQLADGFVEVNFSFEQQTYARPAFRKALARIQEVKSGTGQ